MMLKTQRNSYFLSFHVDKCRKSSNFAGMKRRMYFLTLWIATFAMLLSTMMMHHHHEGRVCLVEERCTEDGNINDAHTEHHENEQEGCRIHQMHHFIINAKIVKSIKKHIVDGLQATVALAHFSFITILPCSLVVAEWQEKAEPLSQKAYLKRCRRGPPVLS